jgi:hypothetical protein
MKNHILIIFLFGLISNTYSQYTPNLKPLDIQKIIQNMDVKFASKNAFSSNLNIKENICDIDLYALAIEPNLPDNGIYQSHTNNSNSILINYYNKNTWGVSSNYQNQNYNISFGEKLFFGTLNCLLKKK